MANRLPVLIASCALAACSFVAMAADPVKPLKTSKSRVETTDRMIIRLKDEPTQKRTAMSTARAKKLGADIGTLLIPVRAAGGQAQVVRLTHAMPLAAVEELARRLARDPDVLYAIPDRRKYPQLVPSDPRFNQSPTSSQWYLFEPLGGINAPAAWDVTTGSPAIVVAIVDTGVVAANPDLAGRLLPGYDFIGSDNSNLLDRGLGDFGTQFDTANDLDGRDADPADPGDWITATEAGTGTGPFADCIVPEDSTWHGTNVASIAAATANNGFGIAGVDWQARILPVRALGKCGGYTSDIMDGARWAAGIPVIGAANQPTVNPRPAHVINLSLGGTPSTCSAFEQTAINEILDSGVTRAIVTSAGNEGGDAANNSPGNCNGVINVGATDRNGNQPAYSNFGPLVTISAPGGNDDVTSANGNGILSTSNCGLTAPIFTASGCPDPSDRTREGSPYIAFLTIGTSESAPQVAGAASLMLAVNPTLSANDVRRILTSTSRPFPVGSNCTSMDCGAGILDVNAAVRTALAEGGTPAPTPAPPTGGGGGGGGCSIGGGPADAGLPLLICAALLGLVLRRRR